MRQRVVNCSVFMRYKSRPKPYRQSAATAAHPRGRPCRCPPALPPGSCPALRAPRRWRPSPARQPAAPAAATGRGAGRTAGAPVEAWQEAETTVPRPKHPPPACVMSPSWSPPKHTHKRTNLRGKLGGEVGGVEAGDEVHAAHALQQLAVEGVDLVAKHRCHAPARHGSSSRKHRSLPELRQIGSRAAHTIPKVLRGERAQHWRLGKHRHSAADRCRQAALTARLSSPGAAFAAAAGRRACSAPACPHLPTPLQAPSQAHTPSQAASVLRKRTCQ